MQDTVLAIELTLWKATVIVAENSDFTTLTQLPAREDFISELTQLVKSLVNSNSLSVEIYTTQWKQQKITSYHSPVFIIIDIC